MCSFCQAHSETILHLLWECKEIQSFWKDLADLLNRRCTNSHNLSFNAHLIIFGESDVMRTDKICELIILTAKLYIYKCKVQRSKVKINIFVKELYNYYSVLKQVQKNSNDFQNAWTPYALIFQSLLWIWLANFLTFSTFQILCKYFWLVHKTHTI